MSNGRSLAGFSYKRSSVGDSSNLYARAQNLMQMERERAYQKTCREMGIVDPSAPLQAQPQGPTQKEQAFDALIQRLGLSDEEVKDLLVKTSSATATAAPVADVPDDYDNPLPADILALHESVVSSQNSRVVSATEDVLATAKRLIAERGVITETAEPPIDASEDTPHFVLSRSK